MAGFWGVPGQVVSVRKLTSRLRALYGVLSDFWGWVATPYAARGVRGLSGLLRAWGSGGGLVGGLGRW